MSQGGILSDSTSAGADIETLTGDSGGAVGPDAAFNVDILGNPDIDMVGTPGSNSFQMTNLTKMSGYIVDSTAGAAPYQTIQAALDAANAAGGGMVFVRPGTYTENLTLYDLTQVIGAVGLGDFGAVIIDGVHVPPATGSFVFRNVRLDSATHVFSSAVAGSASLTIIDALINITNGFLFNLANWTGLFVTYDIGESSTNNGMVNNTGGATCFFVSATHGAGAGNTMVTSGPVIMQEVDFNCPWDAQTGTTIACDYVIATQNITCSNNSTGSFSHCRFTTGANQALTMSSSASIDLVNTIIDTSNNPSIGGAGAGTLELNTISFLDDSAIAGTLTTGYQVVEAGTAYLQNISFDRGTNTVDTNGELIIGSTGNNPQIATLTAGVGITITNGAGSITIANTGQTDATGQTIGAVTDDVITIALGATAGVYTLEARIAGFDSTGPSGCGYQLFGTVRTTGAAAALVGTPDQVANEDVALAAADADIVVNANNAIIRVTGVAARTIDWAAHLEITQITP